MMHLHITSFEGGREAPELSEIKVRRTYLSCVQHEDDFNDMANKQLNYLLHYIIKIYKVCWR